MLPNKKLTNKKFQSTRLIDEQELWHIHETGQAVNESELELGGRALCAFVLPFFELFLFRYNGTTIFNHKITKSWAHQTIVQLSIFDKKKYIYLVDLSSSLIKIDGFSLTLVDSTCSSKKKNSSAKHPVKLSSVKAGVS